MKQHKHVDFIPRNVIDHHQLIIEGGLGLFCNGKIIPRNNDGNWKMTFNYEGSNSLGFSTEVKIGDSVLKNESGIFGRSALWVFLLSKWTYKWLLDTKRIYINYGKN